MLVRAGWAMWQQKLANKNVVIGIMFVMAIGVIGAITVTDYFYRLADYRLYSQSIVSIIEKTFNSEREWLDKRINNYMNALFVQERVPELIRRRDIKGLKQLYDPVVLNFRHRMIPVILFTVVDEKGAILYRHSDLPLTDQQRRQHSNSLGHALEQRRFVSGFENDFLPFWYNTSMPIIDKQTKQLVGGLEVGLDPEWFQFKFGWFFEGVKSAMVVSEGEDCSSKDKASSCYRFVDKTMAPLKDLQFFHRIMPELQMGAKFTEIKQDGTPYLVSTALRFHNHDGKEAGSFLVAYNMSSFKQKQWQYLSTRLMLFLPALVVLLAAIYFGFRKYEQILNEKNRQLAQKLKNCALGEMLGYIGHQWRQPLHTLSLTVQNIELQNRLGNLDSSMLEKQVALANKNIDYLTQTIEDWRSLLVSGTTRQVIDLADSVKRAIGIVAPALENCHIQVENRISGSFKTLGFVNDLVQLTVNVLLNARDALANQQGQRVICIGCSAGDGIVTVTFQDNGGGIPEALLEKIFEAYLTTKDDAKGTGLGLYLCRQIAENLDNGKVWAENRAFEFNGTRFVGACIVLQFKQISEGETA